MLRLYDFECERGHIHEALVDVPAGEHPGTHYALTCPKCRACSPHLRLISPPAKYLGEKVMSPKVYGGQFDTMGAKALPTLPEFPDEGSARDFVDFVHDRDYRDAKRERARVRRENKIKRARAKAARRDPNLSFRHNRVAGDPSFR